MSFLQKQNGTLIYLQSSLLDRPGVRHGFTTRPGGVSTGALSSLNLGTKRGDDMANVRENYRRICAALGMDDRRCVLSYQKHETNIRLVTEADCGKGLWTEREYTSVDAMICQQPGIPLVIFSADCGIILLYDTARRAIGVVHAGWRGVADGLAALTVARMNQQFGTEPRDVVAAIGPGIGKCCFETDDDVPAALRAALGSEAEPYMTRQGAKWHVDLKGLNALWLRRCGVSAERIDVSDHCTACRPDLYWSHRKMGNARGVQAGLLCLEE